MFAFWFVYTVIKSVKPRKWDYQIYKKINALDKNEFYKYLSHCGEIHKTHSEPS